MTNDILPQNVNNAPDFDYSASKIDLRRQSDPLLSDETILCQQITPNSMEFLHYDSGVLITAYNISKFNGKTNCSLRLDHGHTTKFRHLNFNPSDRRERQGLIYQLAQNVHQFPAFIPWDDLINPMAECVVDLANRINTPILRNLADISPEAVKWLWEPYIPYGKITIVEGDPGEGKSHFTLAVATAVSLGKATLPYCTRIDKGKILLVSAEDGLADTIRPRLDRMGADINQIQAIDGLFTFDEKGVAWLEGFIFDCEPRLVIIDPLSSYMGRELSANQGNHVRNVMSMLHGLADSYNVAMITVRHLNKTGHLKSQYRGAGSIEYLAAARSCLLLGCNQDTGERAIIHQKHNLSPAGMSIAYDLTADGFVWGGESKLTADDLLSPGDSGKLGEAEDFLIEMLTDGPVEQRLIEQERNKRGIKQSTLRTAKANLNVVSYNEAVKGQRGAGKWFWKYED